MPRSRGVTAICPISGCETKAVPDFSAQRGPGRPGPFCLSLRQTSGTVWQFKGKIWHQPATKEHSPENHLRSGISHTNMRNRSRPRHKTKARTRGGFMEPTSQATVPQGAHFRWLQLAMGIVCMAMVANLQYGWTLFVDPIDQKYHWGRAAIQLAFTFFVVTETWLVPIEAWFVDKYGPS